MLQTCAWARGGGISNAAGGDDPLLVKSLRKSLVRKSRSIVPGRHEWCEELKGRYILAMMMRWDAQCLYFTLEIVSRESPVNPRNACIIIMVLSMTCALMTLELSMSRYLFGLPEMPLIFLFHPLPEPFSLNTQVPFHIWKAMADQLTVSFILEIAWHY